MKKRIRKQNHLFRNVMSKPREYKPRESKPRDPKERFIKSTRQIPFNLFGIRKIPPTNPTQMIFHQQSNYLIHRLRLIVRERKQ